MSTLEYLRGKIGAVIVLKLKNGCTIFGKLTEVADKSEVVQVTNNSRTTKGENFEVLIEAPIQLHVAIMPTPQGPAPMEIPVPYFSVSPTSSIPFMKDELSMFAESDKSLHDLWMQQTTPIDLSSKIELG